MAYGVYTKDVGWRHCFLPLDELTVLPTLKLGYYCKSKEVLTSQNLTNMSVDGTLAPWRTAVKKLHAKTMILRQKKPWRVKPRQIIRMSVDGTLAPFWRTAVKKLPTLKLSYYVKVRLDGSNQDNYVGWRHSCSLTDSRQGTPHTKTITWSQ